MKIIRRKTKTIKIGNICIGGNNPIAIQSMTKTKTADIEKTIKQIRGLEKVGCEIVRVAVEDNADAKAIRKIKQETNIPLVADIHFNWRLALVAIESGADKIRLNPGNIYKKEPIKEIVAALKCARIPLRIGLNSGSLRDGTGKKLSLSDKLVTSALNYIKIIETLKFSDIVVSLKASNIFDTIEAYRRMGELCNYPFHLGVTATGPPLVGVIKSSLAIGMLLSEGIGDTIRISLTSQSQQEVVAAKSLLASLDLRNFGPEIISCPTCGRCKVDLVKIVKQLESSLTGLAVNSFTPSTDQRIIKVAVMGCVVNGPGEAKEADIGVAFGKKEGLLFKSGKPVKKVSADRCMDVLLGELGCFGQRH